MGFSSAQPPVHGIPGGTREDLREVAQLQRTLLLCILGNIALYVLSFFVPQPLRNVMALAGIAIGLGASYFCIRLSIKLDGGAGGIVLGILSLVPCLGIVFLLVINQKATGVLNQNGVRVGLLGADPASI